MNWKEQFEAEIEQARSARAAGNEGRARVCARRAAGIVIGEFLKQNGYADPPASAYDRLRILAKMPDIPEDAHQAVANMLQRVTPDYQLPTEADLVQDAVWLCETLIPDG